MNTIKAALIQKTFAADTRANLSNNVTAIRKAAKAGAKLVVFSELHDSLYFCQTEDPDLCRAGQPIPGPATDHYAAIAGETGIVLYHNTAVVFEKDGSIAGRYRKMHIPDDPAYYEKFYFTPGDLGFHAIPTSIGKLGVLVCWDQWYPEAARLMALDGADLLIYPTAIGWEPSDSDDEKHRQLDAWVTIQRGHAIANGLPVLSVNRVGYEASPSGQGGIQFWGNSFAAGPQGEFLAQSGNDKEDLLLVDIDTRRTEAVRRIWPFLRDRRIDAYADLTMRYRDHSSS
jgi:N-carbamoylputrescine amidase